jgi:hypothetical protein
MMRFHGVATSYFTNYLGWHRMVDRLGKSITPTICFLTSLGKNKTFSTANYNIAFVFLGAYQLFDLA